MGFFDVLFGGKSKEEREVEKIFDRIYNLLNDDDLQNEMLPEFFIPHMKSIKGLERGTGRGRFGRDPQNPILCNGVIGELTYLSRLVIPANKNGGGEGYIPITFHRLGSIEGNLDVYEIISQDGYLYDRLYMNMYFTGKSKVVPKGYAALKEVRYIGGINSYNENFPYNQLELVKDCAETYLGLPIYNTKLKEMDYDQAARVIRLVNSHKEIELNWWDPA